MTSNDLLDTDSRLDELEASLRSIERLARTARKHAEAVRDDLSKPATQPTPAPGPAPWHSRLQTVLATIRAIEESNEERVAHLGAVTAAMEGQGMTPEETRKAVEHLKRTSHVYQKRAPDGYAIIR